MSPGETARAESVLGYTRARARARAKARVKARIRVSLFCNADV